MLIPSIAGSKREFFTELENLVELMDGFPGGSAGKESTCNAGELGLIPGLGRSPGEGNGNPLQYSGLISESVSPLWF